MTRGLQAEDRWVPGAFDPEELRQKYREERDNWLRPDGKGQYLDVTGNPGRFAADPYLEPAERTRESPTSTCSSSAAEAVCRWQSGSRGQAHKAFLIIDQAGDFGGGWYWNRHSGRRAIAAVTSRRAGPGQSPSARTTPAARIPGLAARRFCRPGSA